MLTQKYDPTLPRTIADLVHRHGFRTVVKELAAYCEVEWVQAKIRSEPADDWRNAGVALVKIAEGSPSQE
ncbi:hypothetical protein [Argonema galeatum]|uniref:hypothetical protein n=1 Tax=Argonema galeatum TaxID=2942762 RepID=UPI0020134145|nr:hypothetical protein [Argonema galeatum]MCL1466195.1 hypothetical protein [Argonema galeatum A003/A1]